MPFDNPAGPRTSRRHRPRALAAALATVLTASGLLAVSALPASAADVDVVDVDFSASTGAFQGGASGMLYGLSDEGVPTDPITAGARPQNVTQKAPHGAQHPNGDPLEVEDSFFRNGGEYLMVNIQDYYPDWSYNGGQRPEDFSTYLDIVRTVVTSIRDESDYPERYIFTPFNEPDGGNWYSNWGALKDTFLADWKATYETIKEVYPEARIAGMGDTGWRADRTRDILAFAKANDVVPDMWTWHELGIDNLATFRSHHEQYRQIERDLGIDRLPVNITEYAMRRDMSVPGQLVQWLAMFEDEKVDAQTAYWTFAGNLNDNMAKGNAANGAWWLLKWYGDLTGDTVALTPPQLNVADTVQGIAAVDDERKTATVLVGGGSKDIRLDGSGLDPAVFGDTVDIQVRESTWTGQEGEAQAPRIVASQRIATSDDISLTIPNDDRLSAFQVVITPALAEAPAVDTTWRTSIEAEDTQLRDVTAYNQPMSDPWLFAASGQRDVGSTNRVTSSLTWAVEVPEDGTYRFGATAGVNGPDIGPGSHALFVDGELAGLVEYEAGFSWSYRGRAELLVELTEGAHELSLRMSADGTTLLPGSDISLDKFDLEHVVGAEPTEYPAYLARTTNAPVFGGDASGAVPVDAANSAVFYVAARANGYHDVAVSYRTDAAASVTIGLNGRPVEGLGADAGGEWTSTARVHLREGINEIVVSGDAALLEHLTVSRAAEADDAITRIEMEDETRVTLAGGARAEDVAAPTNVSGRQVGWLGGEGTATISREALPAGDYDLQVRYANAERNTGHAYNADVITRFLDIAEAGGDTSRGAFRHNYSWHGFWTHTVPVTLDTASGEVTLGNATGAGPNLDWIAFAPILSSVENVPAAPVEPATLEVGALPAKTSYAVGEEFDPEGLTVAVRSADELTVLEPAQYALSGFDSTTAGDKTIEVTAEIGGETLRTSFVITVRATDAPGVDEARVSLSESTVTAGDRLTVSGAGFSPDTEVEIWLYSDPVRLATATTDAAGSFTARVLVPASTTPGEHRIVVRGAGGEAQATLTVLRAADGALAVTGGTIALGFIVLAALMVVGGVILTRIRRRRGSIT